MKILLIHNFYQQPGGEDEVFRNEGELLRSKGHSVMEYIRRNDEIRDYGLSDKVMLCARTVWSQESVKDLRSIIKAKKPDVAHFHNTFPLISPSAYYACREADVRVIQTLHNPRLICPAATLYRKGRACKECLGKKLPWSGVLHACYRQSRVDTGVVTTMLLLHRAIKTWQNQVDVYIASTEFYKRMFTEAGLSSAKISVKPHFVPFGTSVTHKGSQHYALFIGRLAPEKGIRTMLDAWNQLKEIPLKIRGDGPLQGYVQQTVSRDGNAIQLLPRVARSDLSELIRSARFLVWPSEGYYETFGLVAVEAFACGVPVIASRIGVMAEIVRDGQTGLHFTPGDSDDLAAKIKWAWTHRTEMEEMGCNARIEYEAKYTAERNYEMLMEIYDRVHHTAAGTLNDTVPSGA